MRRGRIMVWVAAAALTGCVPAGGGLDTPPRPKPATLPVKLEGPTADTSILASVSTKSGELLILEPDGSVTRTQVDSTRGRQTLRQSDEVMFSLSDVLVADEGIAYEDLPKPPRAQDLAIEAFAARRRSALPAEIARTPADAFLAAAVVPVKRPDAGKDDPADLVTVRVNLRRGVDESAAFAYATCTLAAWSKNTNTPYGRHIRTLSRETEGVLAVDSIFTMSRTTPLGLRVMEREETLRECRAHGIPARLTAGPVEGTEKNG